MIIVCVTLLDKGKKPPKYKDIKDVSLKWGTSTCDGFEIR